MEASSAINAPHPSDAGDEDFFGGEGDAPTQEPELPAAQAEAPAADAPAPNEPPAEDRSIAEAAQQVAAEGQAAAAPPQQEAAAPAAAPAEATTKKSGDSERPYIVLQELPLTEQVLKALLAEIDNGGQVRVAYVKLAEVTARNAATAAGQAFLSNKETLGEKADLAVTPARSFQVKHVAPKQSVTETLDIS